MRKIGLMISKYYVISGEEIEFIVLEGFVFASSTGNTINEFLNNCNHISS